jgi:hypothetical protein
MLRLADLEASSYARRGRRTWEAAPPPSQAGSAHVTSRFIAMSGSIATATSAARISLVTSRLGGRGDGIADRQRNDRADRHALRTDQRGHADPSPGFYPLMQDPQVVRTHRGQHDLRGPALSQLAGPLPRPAGVHAAPAASGRRKPRRSALQRRGVAVRPIGAEMLPEVRLKTRGSFPGTPSASCPATSRLCARGPRRSPRPASPPTYPSAGTR